MALPGSDGATATRGLGLPIAVSAALHAGVLGWLAFSHADAPPPMPPVYKVDIVAAPPGPRAQGQVTPEAPAPPAPAAAQPPPRAETRPADVPLAPTPRPSPPVKAPPATPSLPQEKPAEPAPPTRAGGGPTGGTGTDVATVRTQGIDFPFPGYLNNIVRQIALRFAPRNPNAPLRADVAFIVQRDGSVTGIRVVTASGNYAFDVEARGAIEAAAEAGAFGPLPAGFRANELPVVFSFDPSLLR